MNPATKPRKENFLQENSHYIGVKILFILTREDIHTSGSKDNQYTTTTISNVQLFERNQNGF